MPEAAFTVYVLHRQILREIIKAYHATGNFQLDPAQHHLVRPSTELQRFNDQTEDELLDSIRKTTGYKDLEDVNLDVISDPAQVECDEIFRQCEWYRENLKQRVIHDHDVGGWKVAAYMEAMQDKSYVTKRQSCTCERGIPCAHWVVVMEASGYEVSNDILKAEVQRRLKEEKKMKRAPRKKVDRGRKGHVADGRNPTIPTVTKKPRLPFSDPRLLRGRTPTNRSEDTPAIVSTAAAGDDQPPVIPDFLSTVRNMAERARESAFEEPRRADRRVDDQNAPQPDDNLQAILNFGNGAIVFDPNTVPTVSSPSSSIHNSAAVTHAISGTTMAVTHTISGTTTAVTHATAVTQNSPPILTHTISSGSSSIGLPTLVAEELDKHLEGNTEFQDLVNGIHVDGYTPDLLKHCKLHTFECRFLYEHQEEVGFIKADRSMNGGLFIDNRASEETIKHLEFISAKVLSSGSTYSVESKTHFVKIQEKKLTTEEFQSKTRVLKNQMVYTLRGVMKPIQLQCVCKHPDIADIHNNFDIICSKGGEKLHSKCINAEAGALDYTCAPCNIGEIHKGAVWCEKVKSKTWVTNTCPLDGAMTAVTQHVIAYNPDLMKSFPNDKAHKAVKESIQHLIKGDSNSYHHTMLKYYQKVKEPFTKQAEFQAWKKEHDKIKKLNYAIVRRNKDKPEAHWEKQHNYPLKPVGVPYLDINVEKDDLHGEHRELWSETLKEGCTFETNAECSKCGYHDNLLQASINMYAIPPEDSISLFMAKTVHMGYDILCHQPHCDGTVKIQPLQPVSKPWMITWDIGSLPANRVNDVLKDIHDGDLPKTLQIAGDTYQLSHVLLNENMSHYTSVHYDPKSKMWAFYDGKTDFEKKNSK